MKTNIGEKINIEDIKPDKTLRILTGDRPTGHLHIGHYFGSLKSRVELQDKFETFIEVADVQALTDNFNNPQKVKDNVMQVIMDELAVGIDPNKVTFFIQSMIPEIAELTVYYSNLVTIARLQRNPTVKTEIASKKELFGESVTYGFLGYPVSQAADITAFDATYIPVGDDQLPLIEQCREIVRKFNSIYGVKKSIDDGSENDEKVQEYTEILREPIAVLSNKTRIKGLDGNEKMGKSLGNALFLSDDLETIKSKVMGALTDPQRIRKDDKGNPEVCMVYYYHKLFSTESECKNVCEECKAGARGCVACKKQLINNINKELEPIRNKRKYYEEHQDEVMDILIAGSNHAREVAKQTLEKVKEAMLLNY